MKDDEVLRRIGQAMGEPDFLDDPRWARLVAGELSEEEIKELRADLAAGPQAPDAQRIEDAIEALRPLGEAAHQRLESLFHRAERVREEEPARRAAEKPGRPLLDWLAGWRGLSVGLAAAAAAVLLIVMWPWASAPLPGYELLFEGGEQVVRSAQPGQVADVAELTPRSLIDLRLRPATRPAEAGSIVLIAHLEGKQEARRIDLPFRVSASGTLIVEGTAGELLSAPPGDYRLLLVVVRSSERDRVPEDMEVLLKSQRDAPWQSFVLPVRIVNE